MTETDNKIRRGRIIIALIALAVVVAAFFLFITMNNDRISAQNAQYLEGSTQQSARRISEWMTDSQTEVRLLTSLYESSLTDPDEASIDGIRALAAYTKFSYVTFSDATGMTYDDRGRTADASDRDYFVRGMEGESGVYATDSSLFYDDLSIIFYTPLKYQDEVIGVIAGAYREDSMKDFLATNFFGEKTSTFLCARDGTVVAHSAASEAAGGVLSAFEIYTNEGSTSEISRAELEEAFSDGASVTFDYRSPAGSGMAYVMKLPDYDWMLMRTFPISITEGMQSRAALAGVVLVGLVGGALALVAGYLLVQTMRQRSRLLSESEHVTSIVYSSLALFQRFAVIDLEKNTYEYLKDESIKDDLPRNGDYNMFRYYWQTRFYNEEECARMKEALTPEYIQAQLTEGVPYLHLEYRLEDPDTGVVAWNQASMIPLQRNADGVVTSVLLSVQDVTDVKEREIAQHNALQDAFNEAERASRAKTDFLNSMSHDIRTPMNSIMGLTAIASMYVDDPERVKDCLTKITTSSRHLLGLINEVLDMAKIESGNLGLSEEDFDLPETVESLLSIMTPQINDKKLNLKVEIADIQHEHVVGDPMRLQQVFVNIMGNSVKFTPEGGTVSLRIKELPSRVKGSGCYEFTFSDTGCGMSEDFVKTVFEPFTRANDSRVTKVEGTGLGMSIVRSVVNLMNGTIDVKSKLGEGTTFTVTVYMKLREGDEHDLTPLEGLHVLVADDEVEACESACEVLKSIGMEPDYVLSGDDAVAAVRDSEKNARSYVAIILDWKMPGKSGIEAAREIREIVSDDMPIIILSAYDWTAVEQEARSVGVDAFIAKPLFRSRLVHVMKGLLATDEPEPVSEYEVLQQSDFSGHRVLLTEDNSIAAAIALDIMGMTGLEVDHAENGRVAVDTLLDAEPGHYDLVFMDIQMPVMNGYEAANAIRAAAEGKGPDGIAIDPRPDLGTIPVVALTADAFADDVARARAAGMNAHMSKPMEIELLIKTLKEWL
ncbi:response regulator [Adlercreutzia sp. R21]|uniref:hybrid sensor histidine kinase/response regulator n=1 Tax=Adlercreutzia wanghongyangiae TaxID=3111451 RepID=UPI002DB89E42|nr:response regulator [Adlercreutzia sp. R21]MEC4184229.1 response regulator [Adlercreutzia sp. R21]